MNRRSKKQHSTSLQLKEGSVLHEILKRCAKKVIDDKKAKARAEAVSDKQNQSPKLSPKTRQDT